MARTKLKFNTALDKKQMSILSDRAGKKIINGRISDRLKNPTSSKISRVSEKMLKSGILENTEDKNPNTLSEKILSAMGCSIVTSGPLTDRDYSLLEDQTDTETVENPNKLDIKKFIKIKKQKITIDHIFKNQTDSIFKLDTDFANNYKQKVDKQLNFVKKAPTAEITNFVVKAVDLSLNTPNVSAVRAFKEI